MVSSVNILERIIETPLEFLDRKSIRLLRAFWDGYTHKMENLEPYQNGIKINHNFQSWLEGKYNIQLCKSWSNIILLYSENEEEAFYQFIRFKEEYVAKTQSSFLETTMPKAASNIKELFEVISEIKKRPAMFLGEPSFELCAAYLDGYIKAREDSGKTESEEEKLFSEFKKQIEREKLITTGPSWKKIVQFYADSDGSESQYGALAIFFKWLDFFLVSADSPLSRKR